jgi:hypothetical protein
VGAGGAAGADLDLGVDRDLPGRPGHLRVRQPAGHDRQQRPRHGAASDLHIERSGDAGLDLAVGVAVADAKSHGHGEAEAEEDADEFGFADAVAGRVRGRARKSVSVSRRIGATLGVMEHRVPSWC